MNVIGRATQETKPMNATVELTWMYAQRLSYSVLTGAVAFMHKFELRNLS